MIFLLVASYPDSLINFRGPLIDALCARRVTVHVAAPDLGPRSEVRRELEHRGVHVHEIPMQRTGTNPLRDAATLWRLWRLMRCVQPDAVLGYTVKPVVYGSLAAALARVPRRYALVTGLGYAFQSDAEKSGLQRLVQGLYRLALAGVDKVFFQNPDDEALFRSRGLLRPGARSCIVNGSGVDVARFTPAPLPEKLSFLLIARLLGDKGVREYVEAAIRVRQQYPQAVCRMVGWIDDSPDAISADELDRWIAAGDIEFLGRLADVRPAIAQASVYVLPSYREGTPRTVLEAMAMARAVITTDAPGCRETVVHGDNGFLVPVKSAVALAEAMLVFARDATLAATMGGRGRALAESKYDVHKVNQHMLKEMEIT